VVTVKQFKAPVRTLLYSRDSDKNYNAKFLFKISGEQDQQCQIYSEDLSGYQPVRVVER
jgi:hypothetical protein